MLICTFARRSPGSFEWPWPERLKGPALRNAIRPYVTAGVAFIGASVLAITPVVATPPDVAVVNPGVRLSASPTDPYQSIFTRARANAEALLEAAMGGQPERGLDLEDLLDSLFGAHSGGFRDVIRPGRAHLQLLPTQLDALRAVVSGRFEAALHAVAGDVDAALDRFLVEGMATTREAVQNLVGAMRSGDQAAFLAALANSPVLIADQVVSTLLVSQPEPPTTSRKAQSPVTTFDVDVSAIPEASEAKPAAGDAEEIGASDEGTNEKVAADHGATSGADGSKQRSRLLGTKPLIRNGTRGLTTVRKSIHDVRHVVRDAVKAITGGGTDNDATTAGATESP